MKRLNLLLIATTISLSATAATPVFVGHRGSGYGLENSADSFRKGVELGYDYLETDVKFTKDSVLVCSHDDTTERLGGKLALAESTLAELKAEKLHQTRNGVDYEGQICTAEEYLTICKEGGVRPLIELKYTDGINKKDTSRIPELIALLDRMQMRDKCIILTSQKNCLEYIRTNYPDIELQFLTGQYWPNHFDWCVEWGLDVDIQREHFDAETVKKFHDQGLKVNMWTTNTPEDYHKYVEMGCDFVTTDRLDANELRKE